MRKRTVEDSLPDIDLVHLFLPLSLEPPTTVHDVKRTVVLISSSDAGSSTFRLRTFVLDPASSNAASFSS